MIKKRPSSRKNDFLTSLFFGLREALKVKILIQVPFTALHSYTRVLLLTLLSVETRTVDDAFLWIIVVEDPVVPV